jgi:hypothetical protein
MRYLLVGLSLLLATTACAMTPKHLTYEETCYGVLLNEQPSKDEFEQLLPLGRNRCKHLEVVERCSCIPLHIEGVGDFY